MSQQSGNKDGKDDLYSPLVERGGLGEDSDVDLHPAVELSTKRREETASAIRRKPKQADTWAAEMSNEDMEYYLQENMGVENATEDLEKATFLLGKARMIVGEEIMLDKNATNPRDVCDKCLMALWKKGYDL